MWTQKVKIRKILTLYRKSADDFLDLANIDDYFPKPLMATALKWLG